MSDEERQASLPGEEQLQEEALEDTEEPLDDTAAPDGESDAGEPAPDTAATEEEGLPDDGAQAERAPVAQAIDGPSDEQLEAMSAEELRDMVRGMRAQHAEQLDTESRARAEVEDMCLRIEKHFKAEKVCTAPRCASGTLQHKNGGALST